MLKGRNILLAVTGSIAAYKAASLASMLVKQHADVHVIMTKNAFYRNSGYHVAHIAMAQEADVVMIAPASANVIANEVYKLAVKYKKEHER